MIIPVTLSADASNPKLPTGLAKISDDEIVLIELQGALEVEAKHPKERDGKFIGKLSIDDATSKATLLIGHHLLEGGVARLPKPLAILHRASGNSGPDASIVDVDGEDGQVGNSMDVDDVRRKEQGTAPCWKIVGIVNKKILFSKRPMPVTKRS